MPTELDNLNSVWGIPQKHDLAVNIHFIPFIPVKTPCISIPDFLMKESPVSSHSLYKPLG
jgi:hypothetical protein